MFHAFRRWTAVLAMLPLVIPAAARAQVCDGISQAPASDLTTVRVASGLTRPVLITAVPGDVDRLFLVEQDGRIRILRDGAILPAPFLDVSALTRSPADGGGNEEGLLGLAFHPDYDVNGWLFVYHTSSNGQNNLVARYTVSPDPDVADPASRVEVLAIPHPLNNNHNGGNLAFGPLDGYLYVGPGDGGSFCDPSNNAQNLESLLGKLLRIDVDALPYSVPIDNPFVGVAGLDEIWARGLRNPWRFSFDPAQGDLYIGDVGQGSREEIDYQPGTSTGGENYGWDLYEGSACPNPSCGSATCVLPGHVAPVVEYLHTLGCSVTGGHVYRGCRMPDLHGTYFFADYCTAFLRSFRMVGGVVTEEKDRTAELAPGGGLSIGSITSFGVDGRGELHVIDRGSGATGEIFRIVPVLANLEVSGPDAPPLLLDPGAPWIWEDLGASSGHPIVVYRVYRAEAGVGGFDCVHQSAVPSWDGGDPDDPPAGGVFGYLVTALDAAGNESSPGRGSDGTPRILSTAPCPQ